MPRLVAAIVLCLCTLSGFAQSGSKYQVGTIVGVAPHAAKDSGSADSDSYEVSVQVGNQMYVVLATVPTGTETVKYISGRQVLVSVGEKTLTYNNILGQSIALPILRKAPVEAKK